MPCAWRGLALSVERVTFLLATLATTFFLSYVEVMYEPLGRRKAPAALVLAVLASWATGASLDRPSSWVAACAVAYAAAVVDALVDAVLTRPVSVQPRRRVPML